MQHKWPLAPRSRAAQWQYTARTFGWFFAVGALLFGAQQAHAAQSTTPARETTSLLSEALEHTRTQFDIDLVYSSDLVNTSMRVVHKPDAISLRATLRALLSPHGLRAVQAQETWFVIRAPTNEPALLRAVIVIRDTTTGRRLPGAQLRADQTGIRFEPLADGAFQSITRSSGPFEVVASAPAYRNVIVSMTFKRDGESRSVTLAPTNETILDSIVVSTSRYGVVRPPQSSISLDANTLEILPNVGEDPLRLIQRLPGAATGGLSARVHMRGGRDDETSLVLDGLPLTDPFHLRDYQSVFSAIDRRVLANVDVYTGAFPAAFGDALSSVVEMRTIEPSTTEHEVSASFFHLGAFSSGTFADANGDWVLSARRGNLDWVVKGVNESFGDPDYQDFFARASWAAGERMALSLNLHSAVDQISVIPEAAVDERVEAFSDTRNTHLWATAQQQWSANLFSRTIMSYTSLDNDRRGSSNDAEDVIGQVSDNRQMQTLTLKQDWSWRAGKTRQIQFGGLISDTSARYQYASARQFFELSADIAGDSEPFSRSINENVDGSEFGAYASVRSAALANWAIEAGLRFDRQTYTRDASQWSPRINVMFTPDPTRRFRVSVGRFHQSQPIHELQVEDGVTSFFAAERSDQIVAGFEQQLGPRWQLRAEAYYKRLTRIRPNFENLFDALIVLPELAADRTRIDAQGGRIRGIELTLRSTTDTPLSGWLSYSRSQALDRVSQRDVLRSWDQPHAFSGGVAWRTPRWELSLAGLYRSGWPTTGIAVEDNGDVRIGPRNAERLGHFQTLDLHIARHLQIGRSKLTVFFDVINLTNRANPCCRGFDIEDRDGSPEVLTETDNWLPLVPSLGVRVRF